MDRVKLDGVPMGVIAAETRNGERRVPADPINPASQEVIEPYAGQAWLPDSAHKTGRGSKTCMPLQVQRLWSAARLHAPRS